MNEAQFNNLMNRSRCGHTTAVLEAADAEVGLITRVAHNGLTLLHEASSSGHVELIQGLLERKADIHAKAAVGLDAMMISAGNGHIEALKLLFNSGADMTATDNRGCNALSLAGMYNRLDCAVFLLSRGCDLRLVNNRGESALETYGSHSLPAISDKVKEQRRQILRIAFAEGPHISQIRRRAWMRRKSFVCFGAGCGFQPLAARKALELAANPPLPPGSAIPVEPNDTPEQQQAFLRREVFGNEGIFKTITSFI